MRRIKCDQTDIIGYLVILNKSCVSRIEEVKGTSCRHCCLISSECVMCTSLDVANLNASILIILFCFDCVTTLINVIIFQDDSITYERQL